MLENYFKLYEECYLVKGETKGSIYNLLTGYIYDINEQEQELILLLEKNNSITDIENIYKFSESFIKNTLNKLQEQSLGKYFNKPNYIEKITKYPTWVDYLFTKSAPVVTRAFVNIENHCDKNCSYCNVSNVRRYSCFSCYSDNSTAKKMDKNEILTILNNLKKLECAEIYFTGGNVFLNIEETVEILKYAKNLGFKRISVIYGGDKLNKEVINILIDLNISLTLQIHIENKKDLYSLNILDELSLYKDKLNKNIVILLNNINICLNEDDLNYLIGKVRPQSIIQDPLYSDETEDVYFEKINQLGLTSIDEFSLKKKYNSCLFGTIHINYDGEISPCPGLKDFTLGDINSFNSIFSEDRIYKFWNLKKDLIEKCAKCSHRYACNDCRSLEYKLSGDLYGLVSCKNKV